MTYSAINAGNFRSRSGSLSEKLGSEFAKIETEFESRVKVAKVALKGGNVNTFAFAWQNPESVAIIVQRVVVDVTTKSSTAGALLDVGPAATATTAGDKLIDGLDIATAVICADNITNKGNNGASLCRLDVAGGTTAFITGKILIANAAALAGNVYIEYIKV